MEVRLLLIQVFSLVLILGLIMLSVPIVDLLTGEGISLWFLYFSLLYIAIGSFSLLISRGVGGAGRMEAGFIEAYIASALSWLLVPLLAAVPLYLELGIPYVDALFESVSGFTGTGFTALTNIDVLKKSINWWRALMQWSGELGFVVFAMVILPFFWRFGYTLYGVERPVRVLATLRRSARRITEVYVLLTLLGIVLLYYTGANLYDAVIHTMTAIATGGMSNYSMNFEEVFNYAPYTVIPATLIMILGGMNFLLLSMILDFRFREASRSDEFKYYAGIMATLSLASTLIFLRNGNGLVSSLVLGVFNTVSGMTTTGFNIGDVGAFPSTVKTILIIAMFIGGMTFSTAGGIKVYRFIVLLRKLNAYGASVLIHERVPLHVSIDNKSLEEDEVSGALLIVLLHGLTIFLIASIIKAFMPVVDFIDAVFNATSAVGCVGLSTNIPWATSPLPVKIAMITGMYLGRNEHLPIIVLAGYLTHRRVVRTIRG